MMSSNQSLDVLLLCQDDELQPWQKAIYTKHQEAEKLHEVAMKNYQQEMKQFYAGMGVAYNKQNGEAAPMKQQVSECNTGVTRLVTTLPVTQSPLIKSQPSSIPQSPAVRPLNKVMTPRPLPVTRPFIPPAQPFRQSFPAGKAPPLMTAVRPMVQSIVIRPPQRAPMNIPARQVAPSAMKPPIKPPSLMPVKPVPVKNTPAPIKRHSSTVPDISKPPPEKRQALESGSKSDKYYGFKKGKVMPNEDGDRKFRIKCFHCDSVLPNNILYMEHIRSYLDTSRQGMKDSHLFCIYCFKRFKAIPDLQSHYERCHSTVNKYYCKFCDYSFKSKSVLKSHMQGVHDPLVMPYVCKVCQYRTSVYQDMRTHFTAAHKGAKALQCPHCFKVLRCSRSYLQHCQRHYAILMKTNGFFRCPCCKLQFLSSTERNDHVSHDHKKFSPQDKDGLPAYRPVVFTKPPTKPPKHVKKSISKPAPPPPKIVPPVVVQKAQPKPAALLECLECAGAYSNLNTHLATLMSCSSCSYFTFCGAAYAQHTIVFHSSFKAPPKVHPVKKVCLDDEQISLTCRKCGFSTMVSSTMAWHTVSCSKGSSSSESFVYLKLKQKKLFLMEEDSDKDVIEILSDGE